MLTNTKALFEYAQKKNVAICAFNVFNLESMQAVLTASKNKNVPVIISASESAISYAGAENLAILAKSLASKMKQPVALHLDHGSGFDSCKNAIKAGFTSVMIDASSLPFSENVKLTKKVVDFAHKFNVTVEAELGRISGVEDNVNSSESIYTNASEAVTFVKKTNCDSLAISIGTAHGANKGIKTPKISYETIEKVSTALGKNFPLVAHGSSSVPKALVENINKLGGKIGKTQGISETDLHKMSRTAICKINVDTDLRLAFTSGVRSVLKNQETFNPRDYLKAGRNEITTQAEHLIDLITL